MSVGTAGAIALGAGALVGGVAGALSKNSKSTSSVDAGTAGASETNAFGIQNNNLNQLQGLVNAGPGQSDVTASLGATRDLSSLLQQYSQSGGLPSAGDVSGANGFASQIYDPQRVALQQSFLDQSTQANRQAALLGRSVDDPILQNKLRTSQTQQTALLNSQQGAYGAQLALQMPGQRVNYATQNANTLGNLASQAFQNRSALLALGSQIGNQDRQFRLNTATRTTNQETGGGLGGALEGGLAGFGSIAKLFGSGGAFGGAASSATSAGFTDPFSGVGTAAANAGVQAAPLATGSIPSDMGVGFGQSAPGYGTKSYSLGAF